MNEKNAPAPSMDDLLLPPLVCYLKLEETYMIIFSMNHLLSNPIFILSMLDKP